MRIMSTILSKASVGILAIGTMVAMVPISASALSIKIQEAGGALITIDDGDDGAVDNIISETSIAVGDAFVTIASAFTTDGNGISQLFLNVTQATAGDANLFIDASHTGLNGAAGSPQASALSFTMNSSSLSSGGELLGDGYTDTSNTLFGLGDRVGSLGSITATSQTIFETESQVLTDPFSMTILTDVKAGTTASYDATLVAAVPLPAAGLLLLSALGGVAALRRRRKAA